MSPAWTETESVLRIDGVRPYTATTVREIEAVCDRAEDRKGPGVVPVHVSGAPHGPWSGDLSIPLVTKWERALRRLERLPMTTVAVASGDCGGPALDVLLATDVRLAHPGVRLLIARHGTATWPGMAVFRLSHQAGVGRARRAVLFGEPIEAEEAVELGLVDELAETPEIALAAAAERFGVFSGAELAIRRRLMHDAATTGFEDALGAHLAACDRTLRQARDGRGDQVS
ncbi:enoyl-CoA-hydratase DpgB [Actinomadura sp. DC4]|uniref:enoyl-CoA-hydratase DpgB n=1 Tax=Actinomadura sp. DC4 TaxID=3055069 RepID=UPI0025B1250A|nr:enoyl-CoA-hydratase DpgB [Actinomadura sp. DC4]MDN3360177.1 enoyl-CoA hydratase/isomerase family protein [Actinomadura sp. DC4]